MAGMDTKVIQVKNDPSVINAISNEMGLFGWDVQNVQITHSQDSKTYTTPSVFTDYVTETTETTTINYATITFQRDRTRPNYARLSQLENAHRQLRAEQNSVSYPYRSRLADFIPVKKFILFAVIFLYCFVSFFVMLPMFDIFESKNLPGYGIVLLIIIYSGYKSFNYFKGYKEFKRTKEAKDREYEAAMVEVEKQKEKRARMIEEIREEAAELSA